jgi:hypothetical protein
MSPATKPLVKAQNPEPKGKSAMLKPPVMWKRAVRCRKFRYNCNGLSILQIQP